MAQREIVLELKTETGATEKDLKNVAKGVEKVKEEAQETSKETKKLTNDFSEMGGQLDTVTGGAISKFQGLTGMLKKSSLSSLYIPNGVVLIARSKFVKSELNNSILLKPKVREKF